MTVKTTDRKDTSLEDGTKPERLPKAEIERGQEVKLSANAEVKSRIDQLRKIDSPSAYISKNSSVSPEVARHFKEILKLWNAKTGNRFPDPDLTAPGIDGATTSLIRKFQSENIDIAKKVDGIIGPRTWRAIEERILKPHVGSLETVYGYTQLTDSEFSEITGQRSTIRNQETPSPMPTPTTTLSDASSEDLVGVRTIPLAQAMAMQPTKLMSDYADAVIDEAREINPKLKRSLHECAGPPRRAAGTVGITRGEDTNGSAPGGQSARLYPDWFSNGEHRRNYVEVTNIPQDERTLTQVLPKLPKGAVVQYLDASRPSWHGHIQVSLGDGRFVSDFVHDELVYRNVSNVRVFLPVGSYNAKYS